MDQQRPPGQGQGPGQGPGPNQPIPGPGYRMPPPQQGMPQGGPPPGAVPVGRPGGMQQQGMPRMESYYSNCAVVATSPREISVLFGRYVSVYTEQQGQGAVPVYEKQILMTVEQAEDLVKTLSQAVQDFRSRREGESEG